VTTLERVKAFLRETDERVCDECRTTAHGVALLTPSLPLVWQLNAIRVEDPGASVADLVAEADEVLARAEAMLSERGVPTRTSTVQARAAGPAIVDDANELGADLIVMGLRYKKRFGGQWDAGRTVPYVMRNSTAPVWCLRAETKELAHTP
jgi:nucleotide-binding universal stress UspA family protein